MFFSTLGNIPLLYSPWGAYIMAWTRCCDVNILWVGRAALLLFGFTKVKEPKSMVPKCDCRQDHLRVCSCFFLENILETHPRHNESTSIWVGPGICFYKDELGQKARFEKPYKQLILKSPPTLSPHPLLIHKKITKNILTQCRNLQNTGKQKRE